MTANNLGFFACDHVSDIVDLENFFGCQRQCGGTRDDPSMQELQKNIQALRMINSFARGPAKVNCRGFDGDYADINMQKDNKPLAKHKTIQSNLGHYKLDNSFPS